MSLYDTALGDRLVDVVRYPSQIRRFLELEEEYLCESLTHKTRLIEVGAMDGFSLDVAMRYDSLQYLGIEPVERYVMAGAERVQHLCAHKRQRAHFVQGDACELCRIADFDTAFAPNGDLVFFPFNSFGNIQRLDLAVRALADARRPFLIATYPTTTKATSFRQSYYRACEYRELTVKTTSEGVLFSSSDGLSTWAYHPQHITRMFKDVGISVQLDSVDETLLLIRG